MEFDVRTAKATGPSEMSRRRLSDAIAVVSSQHPNLELSITEISSFSGAPHAVRCAPRPVPGDRIAAASVHLATIACILNPACGVNTHYVPDGDIHFTSTGESVVHFRQNYLGLPVFDATRSVLFNRDGAIVEVFGDTLPVPDNTSVTSRITAPDAVMHACQNCIEEVNAVRSGIRGRRRPAKLKLSRRRPAIVSVAPLPSRPTVLRKQPCEDVVTARLSILFDGEKTRLAWNVALILPRPGGRFDVLVSADEGTPTILFSRTTSAHATSDAYVYAFSPGDGAGTLSELPRAATAYPDFGKSRPAGFPRPWLDGNVTRGNNVESIGPGKKPVTGTRIAGATRFAPANRQGWDAATVNAFYYCNFAHDFFELLGFDESHWNFQNTNYSGVPGGDDRLEAWVIETQTQSSLDNRVDGTPAEMVLGKWASRFAALDADMVLHEYTHGVTNRLIGGRNTPFPLAHGDQSKALDEGYCDYFAISIQNYYRRAAAKSEVFVFAGWTSANASVGLRRCPYREPFPANFQQLGSPQWRDPHDAGQVWAYGLLKTAAAIGATLNDRNLGDTICWQAVVDSLHTIRSGADGPNFIDARDSFLSALKNVAGARCASQQASVQSAALASFAALGMGPKAKSPGGSFTGLVADFGT